MSPLVPRFSIVCANNDAESGQSDLLASLNAQTLGSDQIEVVSSLSEAKGEWVTFPRPQDSFAKNYFGQVESFLAKNPDLDFAMTRIVLQEGNATAGLKSFKSRFRQRIRSLATGRNQSFATSDSVIDLDQQPGRYPYSATNGFFRRSLIDDLGLQFDIELVPLFDDVAFTVEYVLGTNPSRIGYVGSAAYTRSIPGTRKQDVQTRVDDPRFFDQVPRLGYLQLLREATDKLGKSPLWLNRLVLDELDTHFHSEEAVSQQTAATGPVAASFLDSLRKLTPYLDTDQLQTYQPDRSQGPWPEFLLCGFGQDTWHLPYVIQTRQANANDAVKLTYNFSGALPDEAFYVDGVEVEPIASKIRSYRYFGQDLHFERIVWLASGNTVGAKVDGVELPVHHSYLGPLGNLKPRSMASRLIKWERKLKNFTLSNRIKSWAAAPGFVNKGFADSWVICDRLANSSDSGEVLFKYLRANRPEINAWFMIKAGTADHERLVAEGHSDRLLTPGSFTWHKAMRRASILASTHWTKEIFEPAAIADTYKPKFRQVFLQHGVIDRDMSTWLNSKDLSIFVTSTPDEHESIAGDFSPYVFTDKEAKMTGLPRFDEHRRVAELTPDENKNVILLAPTWRKWLSFDDQFLTSEFVRNWMALLSDERIAQAASRQGFVIGFLPHPNLRPGLELLEVPSHVKLFSFLEQSPQVIFARAKFMVTDYSAVAFDVAYLGTPSAYFQFDQERVAAGGHNGRPGYYSYEEQGFGPVAVDVESAVTEIVTAIDNGGRFDEKYYERINQAFPVRDGKCTERVVTAIEQLS